MVWFGLALFGVGFLLVGGLGLPVAVFPGIWFWMKLVIDLRYDVVILMVGWVDLRSGWIWGRTGSTVTFVWVSVGLLLGFVC